jgi:hypothetical protein
MFPRIAGLVKPVPRCNHKFGVRAHFWAIDFDMAAQEEIHRNKRGPCAGSASYFIPAISKKSALTPNFRQQAAR